jgi:hypothetical protein
MPETAAPQATLYEEFSSIVLTIDHLAQTNHPAGHSIHKFVLSTQTLNESMIGLFNYYGVAQLLAEASTLELFQRSAQPVGLPIFILHTAENTEVVTDIDTYAVLASRYDGSVLRATEALVDMTGKWLSQQIEAQGGASLLSLMMLSGEDPDVASPQATEGKTVDAPAPKRHTRQKVDA